jgi:hypothetical protein
MRHHGKPEYEILETHTDPKTVGDREQELQRQYGYEVDKIHYLTLTQRDYSKSANNGVSSSEWKTIQNKFDSNTAIIAGSTGGITTQNKEYKCLHCGKEGKGTAMLRWHFDNCKHKKTLTN